MREIMFRGKRKYNGEWVYGYLIDKDVIVGDIVEFCEDYFNTEFWLKVDPETVGQYTGLKDKNGKEIYEKDVCKLDNFTGVVVFSDGCFRISDGKRTAYFISTDCREVEVIGNIYEHPHLMKGDENE